NRDQCLGALAAARVQRSQRVCVGPARAGPGLGVPDHDQRPGGQGPGSVCLFEGAELVVVTGVAEPGHGAGHLEPGDVVDLVAQRSVTTDDLGSPVPALLGRRITALVRDGVLRAGQGTPQPHVKTGLFEDLARRGDRPLLARFELALGPGPVVVAWSVNQGDLQGTTSATPW